MQLNLEKCKQIRFSIGIKIKSRINFHGSILQRVESFTGLGILMGTKLNFNNHIITMTNKAYGILDFIML